MKIRKTQKKNAAAQNAKATTDAAAAQQSAPQAETPTARPVAKYERERMTVKLSDLRPAPWNPRGEITPESVKDLAASIASMGMIEPVVAMPGEPNADGVPQYVIVAGHRRVKAAEIAGLTETPCDVLVGIDDATARRMTFIENLQRRDADPLLESGLVGNLIADGMTKEEIAAETDVSVKWVVRRLNLAKLSPSWRKRYASGEKITTDCLEHIAAYPEAIQERLKNARGYILADGTLHWSDIKGEFFGETCDLKEAVFDCSKCYKCQKNSGYAPDLFDFDGGKNPALGFCLDAKCYKRMRAKHINDTIEAARASGVKVVKDDPRYNYIATSPKKTSRCNTLYTWENYDKETQILWGEPPKPKTASSSSALSKADRAKIDAERKAKRARNKAIRALAAWCADGKPGEPCNLANLLEESLARMSGGHIEPSAVFVLNHLFTYSGLSSYELVGTHTDITKCAISAVFGNLAVPEHLTRTVAAAVIKSLDTSRNEFGAHRNAILIVRLLGSDAPSALGADTVADIIQQTEDAAAYKDPKVEWLPADQPNDLTT